MASNIVGLFRYEEDFIGAAEKLKSAGFDEVTLMSPIPLHEAEKAVGLDKSPVRRFSLAGALLGAIGGFSLATFSATVFLLPTGGRSIIAIPPFLVITYEMTILLGVLFTLLGFHVVSGLPTWRDAPYVPDTIVDRFTVVVEVADDGDPAAARRILDEIGAEEVRDLGEYP